MSIFCQGMWAFSSKFDDLAEEQKIEVNENQFTNAHVW